MEIGKCKTCYWFTEKKEFAGLFGDCELNNTPLRKNYEQRCSRWLCKYCRKALFDEVHAGCKEAFKFEPRLDEDNDTRLYSFP